MTAEHRVTIICDWCGDEFDTGQYTMKDARAYVARVESWERRGRGVDMCGNCVEDTKDDAPVAPMMPEPRKAPARA